MASRNDAPTGKPVGLSPAVLPLADQPAAYPTAERDPSRESAVLVRSSSGSTVSEHERWTETATMPRHQTMAATACEVVGPASECGLRAQCTVTSCPRRVSWE